MMFFRPTKEIFASASRILLAFSLSFSLIFASPIDAFADVRKADIVLGESVDSRGLSVAQCPTIESEYAIVMSGNGTIYFERNATSPTQIASVTKIMTAIVALENTSADTVISVSARSAAVGESSATLQEGDVLTFTDALKGLMISSGNDASIALAETIGALMSGGSAQGRDAEQVFVDAMNTKATELGLIDTYFTNPHGLDGEGYGTEMHSCALDVVTMAKYAMQNETFRSIVGTYEDTISVTGANPRSITLTNTNELLSYYEGEAGIKTGFTYLAGYCLASVNLRNDEEVYTVVLQCYDQGVRFNDTQVLCDWYYEHNISYSLAHSDQTAPMQYNGQAAEVPVVAEVAHSDWIDKTVKATLSDPFQAVSIFDLNGNVNQTIEYDTLSGNIEAGDKVGTITFKQRNDELITVDLIACEDVAAPDFFEGIGIWWDRLFKGFSGDQTVAENILINQTPLISNKEGA